MPGLSALFVPKALALFLGFRWDGSINSDQNVQATFATLPHEIQSKLISHDNELTNLIPDCSSIMWQDDVELSMVEDRMKPLTDYVNNVVQKDGSCGTCYNATVPIDRYSIRDLVYKTKKCRWEHIFKGCRSVHFLEWMFREGVHMFESTCSWEYHGLIGIDPANKEHLIQLEHIKDLVNQRRNGPMVRKLRQRQRGEQNMAMLRGRKVHVKGQDTLKDLR